MKPDIIIIGSGMGGATLAAALAASGRKILILERGEALEPSPADHDAQAIFRDGVFRPEEAWLDGSDQPFNPGNYYNVGGNSKFYGGVLIRYRKEDFSPIKHLGGTSPGWPISYDDLEPDYSIAEQMYQVCGQLGDDPTEPYHSSSYAYPPVPDETEIADLRKRLRMVGLHPATLPLAVNLERWLSAGNHPWDAFPGTCDGKLDAETVGINMATQHPNVKLQTGCKVSMLQSNAEGKVTHIRYSWKDMSHTIEAPIVVVSAGAVQTAAVLLASRDDNFPAGLANGSGQLGRNFMNHNCSAVLAMHPLRKNRAIYQKTLMVNDFYLSDGAGGAPLGNVQLMGKISGPILAASSPLSGWIANLIAARSFDFYAMSEDLPNPESRVTLKNGQIKLDWKRSNWQAHEALVTRLKSRLRKAGFPIVLSRAFDRRTPSHQCGTACMGKDPATSVVDTYCRAHDHSNLFIVDASVLPTSAAVNPALTIAALALRAARHLENTDLAA